MGDSEREHVPKTSWQSNAKEMKALALTLFLKGFGARHTRRVLGEKYPDLPASRTIRVWFTKYSAEVKEARSLNGEADVLVALEAENDYVEDVSDDFLKFAVPEVMEKGKEKFKTLPYEVQANMVLKEIHNKSQRNDRKILRLDPQTTNNTAINIFAQFAKSKKREDDGISAGDNIIDVEAVEG